MRIKYVESIKDKIIHAAREALEGGLSIEYIALSESEYIQLLEEVMPITRVLIVDSITKVKSFAGVTLKVTP